MEKWFIKNTKPEEIDYEKLNLNKILYKVLVNRNIIKESEIIDFMNPDIEKLNTALLLPDLIKASNLISEKIKSGKKIRIVGDYDVDGVMSTYILYKGLQKVGANVDYSIPHRVKDGYGINENIIEIAKNDGVDLIITCDNGISANKAVDFARSLDMDIIITDHHEVPKNEDGSENLPGANAVINPKRENSKYPFKEICGAVVAYKLMSYIHIIYGVDVLETTKELIPYAAMATVCDVMPLVDENRTIVSIGLKYLNSTEDIGLSALLKESGLEDKKIEVYHIGFIIGPTINSAGRLESADYALKLLLSNSVEDSVVMAKYLRSLNVERQELTEDGFNKIDQQIIDNNLLDKYKILVVLDKTLNESVVGIIAGRIKEKYNRPTIVLTQSKDILKGSGRSIETYNMFEGVSSYKTMLNSFGGHAMACGLSIEEDRLEEFINLLNGNSNLTDEDLIKKVYIDLGISLSKTDISLVKQLEVFEPYGTANPKAKFGSKNLKVIRFSVFGKNQNVIKLVLSDGINTRDAILFQPLDDFLDELKKVYSYDEVDAMLVNSNSDIYLDIVYTPTINDFAGNQKLELLIKNYRASEVSVC